MTKKNHPPENQLPIVNKAMTKPTRIPTIGGWNFCLEGGAAFRADADIETLDDFSFVCAAGIRLNVARTLPLVVVSE
jgi:hypothetical protein